MITYELFGTDENALIVVHDSDAGCTCSSYTGIHEPHCGSEPLGTIKNANDNAAIVNKLRELTSGGPDTPCRTHFEDGIECVSIPIADLREMLEEA